MSKIVQLLVFYKEGFGIKLPTEVDMPLNQKPYSTDAEALVLSNDVQFIYIYIYI